jgi:conserved oligomeric Golgi complex subunit 4
METQSHSFGNINQKSGIRNLPSHEEDIDIRDIDKLTTEVAGIIGRWFLFRKFLMEYAKV